MTVALDKAVIGTTLPATTLTVERARLRFFAKAIGETDPVYTDVDAAKAAGHPDIPAPPPSCSRSNWRARTRSRSSHHWAST